MFKRLRTGKIGVRLAMGFAMTALLGVGVTTAANLWTATNMGEQALQQKLAGLQGQLISALEAEATRALSMATTVAETAEVQRLFAERNRDALAALFVPSFAKMRDEQGVRQFQFHIAPATSFLRVHKPEKFDDDLSSFRLTVVAVNKNGRAISGLERGRAGLGMRGVVPVTQEGEQVGSVEFGLSFDQAFFDGFTARTSALAALYVLRDEAVETFATTFPAEVVFDEAVLRRAAAETGSRLQSEVDIDGIAHAALMTPVTDFSGNIVGVAVIGFDRSVMNAALNEGRLNSLGIGIAVFLASMLIAWSMNRSIARPISNITAVMRRLAKGEIQIDVPGLDRRDELGDMAGAVQVFKENASEARRLGEESAHASQQAEREKREATLKMAEELENSIKSVVETVASTSSQLQSSARSMSGTAGQTVAQATAVGKASDCATQNIQMVASSAEQLSGSISEISQQVSQSTDITQQAITQTEGASSTVEGLAEAAQKIGDVVSLIQDIAEQTNLLALNATIEAARAGEAGKGFAVVASEVKLLASQTAKATEEISGQIASMQSATSETVNAISGVRDVITRIGENASAISSAVEEQNTATLDISRSVAEVAEGTQEVTTHSRSMSDAAETTGNAAEQVLTAADELSTQSDVLRSEVDSFLGKLRSA
ncbi:methyl-accepting chemotaxis protein [Denitrobaculum tricleocarpae]|uniref:Methyl-accepting chemotaxis protein n=1 Tax=Denitrobaculum tricleocarpae TaxID=2591009 RepID=A0A545TTF4_9PROT|nr:methyl-accepting chemotaxis protein [Denitrobaculum tricleocarpae]TQV80499.1 methyl-accepting chemotaxis protein [Denitrobaculum tricleocarpae]